MFLKGLKKAVVYVTAFACVMGVAACGKDATVKETEEKNVSETKETTVEAGIYKFDERSLYDDKEVYLTDFYLKENELYYTYAKYPEVSNEYMEAMEALYGSDELIGLDEEMNEGTQEENEGDRKSEEQNVEDVLKEETEISDEELVGDMDELFDTGKDDEQDKTQNDEQESEEDIKKKRYEEIIEQYKPEVKFCKYNIETGKISDLYDDDETEGTLYSLYVDDNEQKIYFASRYNMGDEKSGTPAKETFHYVVKDNIGKIVSDIEISDIFLEGSTSANDIYVEKAFLGKDGTLYCAVTVDAKTTIYKIKSDGTLVSKVEHDSFIYNMFLDNEDNLIVVIDGKGEDIYKSQCMYVDFQSKKIDELIEGAIDDSFSGQFYKGNGSVSFLVMDNKGLYAYNKETKSRQQIFETVKSGLLADDVKDMMLLEDGRIFCICCDNSGMNKVGFFLKQEGEVQEKEILKIASAYNDPDLQEIIVNYNKQNSDYEIEYVTYENNSEPWTAFVNDVIAGNIPDIIEIGGNDISNLIEKGMLEDLGPYLEKDDTINKDYFVDGILDATAYEEKNYFLLKTFMLDVYVGKKTDLGKYNGSWTVNDLIELYKSKPNGTRITPYDSKQTAWSFVKSDVLAKIDTTTGEVNIDCEETRKLLEFCNSFEDENDVEFEENMNYKKLIENGDILLMQEMLGDTADLQLYRKLYDNDVEYIGSPSKDCSGVGLYPGGGFFAMTTTSENKEAAWEFIKFTYEYEQIPFGMPTSKSEFEKMVKRDTTTTSYTEEDGTIIEPRNSTFGWNDYDVKIKPATDDEIELLRNLIKNSKYYFGNSAVNDVVYEDVEKYFKGNKSLDDTLKVMQDKVSKYVNENR